MNIKKILLTIAMVLPMLSGADINAQGVVVYKSDGTRIEVPYNELDSIVTYEAATPGQGSDTIGLVGTVADAVDLGLPSGTLWASWNVGATKPEEYGGYYAWGETLEKETYTQDNYKYYDHTKKEYINIGDDIFGTEYDVAHVMWGDGWHMPTEEQIQELSDKCTWTWITYNDYVYGYKVTGPNGNSIFLPAPGTRSGTSLSGAGSHGGYWSSTISVSNSSYASVLGLDSGNHYVGRSYRYYGRSVRPVK